MQKENAIIQNINSHTAFLLLESGDIFWGYGLGKIGQSVGELCFNTSQTGYQEILTDPSYAKQIITFTFPHIGIVGTNENDQESSHSFASGCVLSSEINNPSNWRAKKSLTNWLIDNNISCITNIDTRFITRILSTKGALKAALVNYENSNVNLEEIKKKISKWSGLENLDLAKEVSTKKPYLFNDSEWNHKENKFNKHLSNQDSISVACIDYGAKKNIFRSLVNKNLDLVILPAQTSFEQIISYNPKGIFLSNGPGDPFATSEYAVPIIQKLINKGIPIFGICLGHQILSLAFGAKTKKMYQGHRGANHPVKNLETQKVEITCQNHGFEVLSDTLPSELKETHISLFDNTNEGIKHNSLPIFSVQYHPESSPGPHDSKYLFDQFYKNIKKYAKKN
jgi:carbamoyl-phosphate synthase small subunit